MQTVRERLRKAAKRDGVTVSEHKTRAKWNGAAASRLAGKGLFGKVNPTRPIAKGSRPTPAKKASDSVHVRAHTRRKPR